MLGTHFVSTSPRSSVNSVSDSETLASSLRAGGRSAGCGTRATEYKTPATKMREVSNGRSLHLLCVALTRIECIESRRALAVKRARDLHWARVRKRIDERYNAESQRITHIESNDVGNANPLPDLQDESAVRRENSCDDDVRGADNEVRLVPATPVASRKVRT